MNRQRQESSVKDPVEAIEQLADQSAQDGFYGLQDANLLLADILRDMQVDKKLKKALPSLASDWFVLMDNFKHKPQQTSGDIITYLRRPELNAPLVEEEFAQLAEQISHDANTAFDIAENDAIGRHLTQEFIADINLLADQAASEGLYGLQDANLLLAEASQQFITEGIPVDPGFMSALANWRGLIGAYRKEPQSGAAALITFLRHPTLNLPIGEDEFAMLQEQLQAEVTATENFTEDNQASDPAITTEQNFIDDLGDSDLLALGWGKSKGLVELLMLQVSQIRGHLQTIEIGNNLSSEMGLQNSADELERFGNAALTADFESLSQVCAHVLNNLQIYLADLKGFNNERLDLLLNWLEHVQEYLPIAADGDSGQLILFGLTDEAWALPLSFEEMAAILQQIRSEGATIGVEEPISRKQSATDEDVSLALPDDVNQELLDLLLQELPVQAQQFSEAVQRLHIGGNQDDVQLAQRVAHTLKGSANTVGIKAIAVLTHQLEDILIACANEQKLPSRALANSLINASDCLETMSEALMGSNAPPADAKAVLQEILDWANKIDKDGVPEADSEETAPSQRPTSATTTTVADAAETTDATEQAQATVVRVSGDQIETLFRVSGESIILNSQAYETTKHITKQLQAMQVQFDLLQKLGAELEQLIDLRDLTGRSFIASQTGFDAMEMDQYNELHTASRRMAEAAIDAREISQDIKKELLKMDGLLEDQQRQVIDIQEVVMQTRLVSIATITPRLQRSLRQTCRMTGKQSELSVVGEQLMVDGDTLNAIVDPLMHILRNAVDHGIEAPEQRTAIGKPASGHIAFEFEREGNNILVRCRDDGKGLDYDAIRAAAEKRGLLDPGDIVSEEDLKRFILRPNFSSRTVSTQTSGRGVGMDVVRAQIVNMGGSLSLHSVAGQGMMIELRVPLPLSLTYALLTYVGRYRVAIANKGISQIVYSNAGTVVIDNNGNETLHLDGNIYPAVRLIDMLHVPDSRKNNRPYSAILMVEDGMKTTAVLIDTIVDSLEVVIKGMGRYIGKIPGYIGATILGDGAVTPVLDIAELLRMPVNYTLAGALPEMAEMTDSASNLPTVLVVDDSLSQRRALEQLLSDAGFRVRTARDGVEAIDTLANFMPDAVLTDLEMPRMNGIDLSSHIRNQDKLKHLPVIMITSRTTQKHRQLADEAGVDAYFTKPVRDEDLLTKITQLMDLAVENQRANA